MITAAYGYGLGIAYYVGLLCIALVAHGVWLVRTTRTIWLWQWSIAARLTVILAAIFIPIIGFYGALVINYVRRPSAFHLTVSRWSFILPTLAICLTLCLALQQNWRYTEATQSWDNVVRFLPGYFAFYCVTHAVLYMAARVLGLAHRGPLATRVHLVSMAVVVLAAHAI
jgi:hypothetical protein